jgi:hypothetical protein
VIQKSLVGLLVVVTCACSGGKSTTTSPSPTPNPTASLSLAGKVTNLFTGSAISGATVSIADGPNAGKVATTDISGAYDFTALQQSGFTVTVSADNYISGSQGVTLTATTRSLNFQLRPQLIAFTLTGRVTDAATAGPIAGAKVSINGEYAAGTDNSGHYSVTGQIYYGGFHNDYTYVSAGDYESDYRYILGSIQNARLSRIERFTAGESKVVTIAPDDTLCVNNAQDLSGVGTDYLCRTVHVVVPADGVMTVDALSTQDSTRPPLEVEIKGTPVDWSLRNPKSPFQVTAGTEVVVHVEMASTSTTSQSFVVNTCLAMTARQINGYIVGSGC